MKRSSRSLFLLVLLAFTFTVKAQTENKEPFELVSYRKTSKSEVAEISFTLKEGSKVDKVYVKLPGSDDFTKIDVSEDPTHFIKVLLKTVGNNTITFYASEKDIPFGYRSINIEYKPTETPGAAKTPVSADVIGGTKKPKANTDADTDDADTDAATTEATVKISPTGDISRYSSYSVRIDAANIPADADKLVVSLSKGNGKKAKELCSFPNNPTDKLDFNQPFDCAFTLNEGENNIVAVITKPAKADTTVELTAETLTSQTVKGGKVKGEKVATIKVAEGKAVIKCDPCGLSSRNGINTRAIIGLEQAGASSADSKTRPFLNLFVNFPVAFSSKVTKKTGGKDDNGKAITKEVDNTNPPFAIWTDFRFSSTTVQSFAKLANVSTTLLNPFFASGGGSDSEVNNIVQSFQLNAGIDYRIVPERSLIDSFIPGKNSISFIAGGGVTNPLKSEQTAQIFKIPTVPAPAGSPTGTAESINPAFIALFPGVDFKGKSNIAFVSPERDRFFRRWFAGVRLKTRFFENEESSSLLNQSPAMLDITFGQDEAITRKLTGKVLTIEGFMPFPIRKLDYIYLFGGTSTLLTRKVNETIPPFFFEPPVTSGGLTNNNTVIVPIDSSVFTRSNRDTFRFGIGIDLIRLLLRSDASSKK